MALKHNSTWFYFKADKELFDLQIWSVVYVTNHVVTFICSGEIYVNKILGKNSIEVDCLSFTLIYSYSRRPFLLLLFQKRHFPFRKGARHDKFNNFQCGRVYAKAGLSFDCHGCMLRWNTARFTGPGTGFVPMGNHPATRWCASAFGSVMKINGTIRMRRHEIHTSVYQVGCWYSPYTGIYTTHVTNRSCFSKTTANLGRVLGVNAFKVTKHRSFHGESQVGGDGITGDFRRWREGLATKGLCCMVYPEWHDGQW